MYYFPKLFQFYNYVSGWPNHGYKFRLVTSIVAVEFDCFSLIFLFLTEHLANLVLVEKMEERLLV